VATYSYSALDVSILVGTFEITGFASDSFIEVRQAGNYTKTKITADGQISRTMRRIDYYEVDVTLAQTSDSNTTLNQILNLDRSTGDLIVPVFIKDHSTGTSFMSLNAWVQKLPDTKYSAGLETRKWTLCLASPTVDYIGGGGNQSAFSQFVSTAAAFIPNFLS
jgi:hypothetical protein